jgi:hypothetical protein
MAYPRYGVILLSVSSMQGIPHRTGGGGDFLDLNKRREVQNEKETFNLCEYKVRNDTKLCT